MLGRAVVEAFTGHHSVVGIDLPDGDLTDPAVVSRVILTHHPEWVVHTAAFTDVDGSETHREEALRVNGGATSHLATCCSDHGVGLTYISSDYVFPGTAAHYDEQAARDPVNHYGLTKARGEEAVAAATCPWQIVRTSWLFGPGPRNFVLTIRRLLDSPKPIRVVVDQTGCPSYAPDLAELLLCLIERNGRGYFHGTNAGACTWFQFAQEIARLSGADPERIGPCTTEEYPTPARRPANSILVSRRVEELGCPPQPPWQDALARYIQLLSAAEATDGENRTGP
jgi:dTDP-4-dehydrorhamnose reductase